MSERENNVYKAKLAEQAERYDGELNGLAGSAFRKRALQNFCRHRCPVAAAAAFAKFNRPLASSNGR